MTQSFSRRKRAYTKAAYAKEAPSNYGLRAEGRQEGYLKQHGAQQQREKEAQKQRKAQKRRVEESKRQHEAKNGIPERKNVLGKRIRSRMLLGQRRRD